MLLFDSDSVYIFFWTWNESKAIVAVPVINIRNLISIDAVILSDNWFDKSDDDKFQNLSRILLGRGRGGKWGWFYNFPHPLLKLSFIQYITMLGCIKNIILKFAEKVASKDLNLCHFGRISISFFHWLKIPIINYRSRICRGTIFESWW